jgi:hypothetical protein
MSVLRSVPHAFATAGSNGVGSVKRRFALKVEIAASNKSLLVGYSRASQ